VGGPRPSALTSVLPSPHPPPSPQIFGAFKAAQSLVTAQHLEVAPEGGGEKDDPALAEDSRREETLVLTLL
jgi:hypothetical protein